MYLNAFFIVRPLFNATQVSARKILICHFYKQQKKSVLFKFDVEQKCSSKIKKAQLCSWADLNFWCRLTESNCRPFHYE